MRLFMIVSFVNLVSASLQDISKFYENGFLINHQKRYEEMAEKSLNYKISCLCESSLSSMFYPVLGTYLNLGGLAVHEEYEKFINGLENYIKRYTLTININSRQPPFYMTETEKDEFMKKMGAVVEEENYFDYYDLGNYSPSPATLNFIFSALKVVRPYSRESINLVASFAKYCKTDAQLAEPLSMIVTGLDISNLSVPFVKFNEELDYVYSENYNNFIERTYLKCFTSYESLFNFARNIIYGPIPSSQCTQASSNKLFKILHKDLISSLSLSVSDFKQLIRFIFRSDTYLKFADNLKIFSKKDPKIKKVLNLASYQYDNLQSIELIRNFDLRSDSKQNSEKTKILESISTRMNLLDDYYFVDKNLVEDTAVLMYHKIMHLLEYTAGVQDEKLVIKGLLGTLLYFETLPEIEIDEIDGNFVHLILDFLLRPYSRLNDLIDVEYKIAYKILSLPFIKIDLIVLTKIFNFYDLFILESKETNFHNLFSWVLYNRDGKDRFEIFKNIHSLAQSLGIEMDHIIQTAITKLFYENNRRLIKEILDYSKEYCLLSKSFILFTERLLGLDCERVYKLDS